MENKSKKSEIRQNIYWNEMGQIENEIEIDGKGLKINGNRMKINGNEIEINENEVNRNGMKQTGMGLK